MMLSLWLAERNLSLSFPRRKAEPRGPSPHGQPQATLSRWGSPASRPVPSFPSASARPLVRPSAVNCRPVTHPSVPLLVILLSLSLTHTHGQIPLSALFTQATQATQRAATASPLPPPRSFRGSLFLPPPQPSSRSPTAAAAGFRAGAGLGRPGREVRTGPFSTHLLRLWPSRSTACVAPSAVWSGYTLVDPGFGATGGDLPIRDRGTRGVALEMLCRGRGEILSPPSPVG